MGARETRATVVPADRFKMTRFAAELFEDAAAEGARQSRSARQQLDHWVRVGRAVSSGTSTQHARVAAALAGEIPMSDLSVAERTAVNAELTASIEEKANAVDFGAELAAEGITTVALDADGNLVEHRPDGSSSILSGSARVVVGKRSRP